MYELYQNGIKVFVSHPTKFGKNLGDYQISNPISYFDLILTPLVHEYKLYIENCKINKYVLLTACDHSPLSTSFLKLDAFGCKVHVF